MRRLPATLPTRHRYLDRLSYTFTSEHGISASRRSLDEAVRYGKRAREEAIITSVRETDPELYLRILDSVGYALSQRNAIAQNTPDLDDAIEYTRELIKHMPRNAKEDSTTVTNLVSRLRTRHIMQGDSIDHDEAMQLISEQLSETTPGTLSHGMAVLRLGEIAFERFEKTDAVGHVDQAISYFKTGLAILPRNSEKRCHFEEQISKLYSSRNRKSGDLTDIRNAIRHSDLAVAAMILPNPSRADRILRLIYCLRDFVNATTSVIDVDEAIKRGEMRLKEMPKDCSHRFDCRRAFSDVIGRKYILTGAIENLVEVVRSIKELCNEYNERVKKSGSQGPIKKADGLEGWNTFFWW